MIINILKDVISFIIYVFICPFIINKKAILLYHSIENSISSYEDPYKVNVTLDMFGTHMSCIANNRDRYTVTFDDGYENIYLNAFPLIRKYNINSILFLITDYVDKNISMDTHFCNRYSPKPLTWDEVNEMKNSGMEIGCHSKTHINLARLDTEALTEEIASSTKRIEEMTNQQVCSFAFPFGNANSFNKKTIEILKNNGYNRIYTNIMGMDNSQRDPCRIRRIRIYGSDSGFRFKMKIAGAYNWVDMLQYILV
tara:strand:- start:60 stop:821 length:762 start_codon:yes stop_codon:yes gene_type:complete